MALTSAEKQRRWRKRPELLKQIEAKFRTGRETKMVSVNLDKDVLDGMEEIAEYFGLSGRSRTTQLNAMLRARIQESRDLIELCDQMVDLRAPDAQAKIKAMVLEIFLLGGSRKDVATAHEQFFEQAKSLADRQGDLTVRSGQIDLLELEVIKSLSKEAPHE